MSRYSFKKQYNLFNLEWVVFLCHKAFSSPHPTLRFPLLFVCSGLSDLFDNHEIYRECLYLRNFLLWWRLQLVSMSCWDCWRDHLPDSLAGKRVVELGATTSIPGLAAVALGTTIVLMDIPKLLPNLQTNLDENAQKYTPLLWNHRFENCDPADHERASEEISALQGKWNTSVEAMEPSR